MTSAQTHAGPWRSETHLPAIALAVVVLHALYMCFDAATSGQHWVAMLYDDFFYYMKVAENWVDGHGSTFNGLVPTNGYHPLWFLVLAGAYAVLGSGKVIFYFVCVVVVAMSACTFHLVRRLSQAAGVPAEWASVVGVYITAFCMRHYITGMEAILCLPLAFWFLVRCASADVFGSPRAVFSVSLIGATMVLSRLDSVLLMALVALAALATPDVRRRLSPMMLAAGVAGMLPVAVYVATNVWGFGTVMPVSGMAKQLMPPGASWAVVQGVWGGTLNFKANVVFWLVSLAWCTVQWPRLTWAHRLLWAGMAFPLASFLLLTVRSDWCLSDWYLYPIRVAVACGMAYWLSTYAFTGAWLGRTWAWGGAMVVALGVMFLTNWRVNPGQLAVYQTGAVLAEFEKTHPGIYAMGDRAGKVGYLMKSPVVQLEGLVMDKDFLTFMKRSAPLEEVLRHYKADYYVGSSHEPFETCFRAVEPYQSGPKSPKIVGELCEQPVARFTFGGVETLVYRMR